MRRYFLLLIFFCSSAKAQTLEEVWESVRAIDIDLKKGQGNVDILSERQHQADLLSVPDLVARVGQNRAGVDSRYTLHRSSRRSYADIRLSQRLFDPSAASFRQQARMRVQRAELDLATTKDWMRFEIAADYIGSIQERRKINYWERVLLDSQRIRDNLDALERVGLINRETYNFFLVRLSRLRIQGQEALESRENFQGRLRTRSGLQEIQECTASLEGFNFNSLVLESSESPEIKARSIDLRLADEQISLEKYKALPSLNLFAEKNWSHSFVPESNMLATEIRNWSIGIEINWSLTDSLNQLSRVREYQSARRIAALEKEQAISSHQLRFSRLRHQNNTLADRLVEIRKLQSGAINMLDSLQEQDKLGIEVRSNVINNSLSALEIILNTLDDETNVYLTHLSYLREAGIFDDRELVRLSQSICKAEK